jgi:hypothetical protein
VALVGTSTFGTVLLVWAAVLLLLVTALSFGTRRKRPAATDEAERRALPDRRQGEGDRRVGLPDLRSERVERRADAPDRRSGAMDRRRPLGAV